MDRKQFFTLKNCFLSKSQLKNCFLFFVQPVLLANSRFIRIPILSNELKRTTEIRTSCARQDICKYERTIHRKGSTLDHILQTREEYINSHASIELRVGTICRWHLPTFWQGARTHWHDHHQPSSYRLPLSNHQCTITDHTPRPQFLWCIASHVSMWWW